MMKRKIMILVLSLGLWLPLKAQAENLDDAAFQKKQERLQSLIVLRLKEEAGLSEEQALKVSGVLSKYHQKKRELRKKLQDQRLQLKAAVDSNDSQRINSVIGEMQKIRGEMDKLDEGRFSELKAFLSPAQQGKFLLVMDEIRKEAFKFHKAKGGPPSS